MLVGDSNIDSVEQLTGTTECSNQVDTIQLSGGGHLVLLLLVHPSMLSMICIPDYIFVMLMRRCLLCMTSINLAAANCI